MKLSIHEPLGVREALAPLRIGGAPAEITVPGAEGLAASFGFEGSRWWLRPLNDAVRLNGMRLREPAVLADGDVLQVGDEQLVFVAASPALHVTHLAGNQTVAPLQQDVLPGEAVSAGAAEILAAVEAVAGRAAAREHAPRKIHRAWWLAAVPGALLLAGLAALFRVVSVPLQVSPAAARVEVPGWFSWRAGEALYLMPGTRRLPET